MRKLRKVAVGGTFDELHKGHRVLLVKAFEIGDHVLVGLCSDKFVEKLGKPHATASYMERRKELKKFLKNIGVTDRAEIVPLHDPYGPTVTDRCIEGLVVSQETEPAAKMINEKRERAGLPLLKIFAINLVPSENCSPISTTRIRRGEMDREGRLTMAPSL
jgi:pantetheine-phosphate adenylyltransferase